MSDSFCLSKKYICDHVDLDYYDIRIRMLCMCIGSRMNPTLYIYAIGF